jgi:hypothetical protein
MRPRSTVPLLLLIVGKMGAVEPFGPSPLDPVPLTDPARAGALANLTRTFALGAARAAAALGSASGALPTADAPFIFFHQRKAGGSTMREQLARAAHAHKLQTRMPCEASTPCATYHLPFRWTPRGRNAAVYAGHLYFADAGRGLRQRTRSAASYEVPPARFSCVTIMRQPLSRAKSCWDYRFRKSGKPFDALAPGHVRGAFAHAIDVFGFGCNNEALRVFADAGGAEETINQLTSTSPWHAYAEAALGSALRNMGRCVVGTLERCQETSHVLGAYFPFLAGFVNCSEKARARGSFGYKVAVRAPSRAEADARDAAVLAENALDVAMYAYANAALDAELAWLNARPH